MLSVISLSHRAIFLFELRMASIIITVILKQAGVFFWFSIEFLLPKASFLFKFGFGFMS